MKIYHTETQADYDALINHLKELDYKYIYGSEFSEERQYVIVRWTDMVMRSYQELMEDEVFNSLPIIKYKAKADEKMRFTKENVIELFDNWFYEQGSSRIDLGEKINALVDELEKVVVPEFVAEWIQSYLNEGGTPIDVLGSLMSFHASFVDESVIRWFKKNAETMLKALTNGYTIEEPLYEVVIHETEDDRLLLVTNESCYKFELESDNEGFWKQRHTESEIKKIDERYWAFSVPVEETE